MQYQDHILLMDEETTDAPLYLQKPVLPLRLSSASLFSPQGMAPAYPADATTQVTLEILDQAELTIGDEEDEQELHASNLHRYSLASNTSPALTASSIDGEASDSELENNNLANMLHNIMVFDGNRDIGLSPLDLFNVFSDDNSPMDSEYLKRKIMIDKLDGMDGFRAKLKHFFVLSTAGKPIYSMNGSDDVILGYMGLITTIVSTFQDSMKTEIHHILQDGFKMVVMNKGPLLLVAISKVAYELVPSTESGKCTIENQLTVLYNYLLAVLSKPVITKNFEKRMNYDLRRMLTPQDFHVLDVLSMKITYGFLTNEDDEYVLDGNYYISTLLGGSIQCGKITNTTRSKLNTILLSTKKLKVKRGESGEEPVVLDKILSGDKDRYLASDLLFGFLCVNDKIVSHLRPKNHRLDNQDINTLLSIISSSFKSMSQETSADLWIPVCMPNFNSLGFLYMFVKSFDLPIKSAQPITIILLSGNKNSFYDMKQTAEYIIFKILRNKTFSSTLSGELSHIANTASLLQELGTTAIKHYIYKRKLHGQFYMDDLSLGFEEASDNINALFHIIYFYTTLHNSKATIVDQGGTNQKKLTYTRWHSKDGWVTGFMLADEKYEFYCLCGGSIQAQEIIDQSLKIINWCDRYKKRLFIGDGISF